MKNGFSSRRRDYVCHEPNTRHVMYETNFSDIYVEFAVSWMGVELFGSVTGFSDSLKKKKFYLVTAFCFFFFIVKKLWVSVTSLNQKISIESVFLYL